MSAESIPIFIFQPATQKGQCVCCREVEEIEAGRERGLLCDTCNQMLALMRDDARAIRKAIEHLQTKTRRRRPREDQP